ncbi:MAG: Fic family protein [Proteobacteria bacterium]|jgi:Fic family protein|nr:Fic family protein [Pseudomonadota bacterium]
MARREIPAAILAYLAEREASGRGPAGADAITEHVAVPRPTVNRHLRKLLQQGALVREGNGPATVYRRQGPAPHTGAVSETAGLRDRFDATVSPSWSASARALREQLLQPLGTRAPVSYQRHFVDAYEPNRSFLLPPELASSLFADGRTQGQQPAGTYARKVLEQLLIDLSWASSRLEGNRKTLLDTRALFAKGRSETDDADATMLLNHKDAIEFMVDEVPIYGMTVAVVRNLHSLLMQGLLADSDALGAIRTTVVHISDSVYVPTQVPSLLEEMLGLCVDKARNIKNPLEAAFFLWVNLAYLQPFADGNKRTSRLSANLPLMLANCAPLSFLDVEPTDYALAMLGVYERLDLTLAIELFAWTYRRSIPRYRTMLEAIGAPNPFRAKYREHLSSAVQQIVAAGTPLRQAIQALGIPAADEEAFASTLREELRLLEPYNCARYRLPIGKTQEWIAAGRIVR